ncbi:MAG: DNA-binding protein WhiA [Clostridia bacterium]|nr:DNA-binding protein WhiA [Clostridia bacterium]
MSFSLDVKNELLSVEQNDCCRLARDYAFLLYGRAFSVKEIAILTEHEAIATAFAGAIKHLSGAEISPEKTKGEKFRVSVTDKAVLSDVAEKLGLSDSSFKKRVNFANIAEPCCYNAFLRGVFLACGTVTDPEKEYHLEFSVSSKGLADDLMHVFDEFEPTPKVTQRSGSYTVYFKNSADIEDVLAIMGATENSMMYMHAKVVKDIRNTVNRKVNFEQANINRTVVAATKQYEAIAKIKEKIGFDALPPELREIAKLRYIHREVSNAEIASMLSKPLTVSGVNHRFQKLIKIAGELK